MFIWTKNFKEHLNWACLSVQRIFFHLSHNLHMSCFSAFNDFSLFIWSVSRTFRLYMFEITGIVLGWIQLNCPWHSLVCSIAPDDSQLHFMISCWCSMQHVNTFIFHSPIYLPLHEGSNWYTPGWLLGSSLGSFLSHRIPCKFWRVVKVIFLFTFLNYFVIFSYLRSILSNHWVAFELM